MKRMRNYRKNIKNAIPAGLGALMLLTADVQAAPPPDSPLPGASDVGVQLDQARDAMERQRVAEQIEKDEATRGEKVEGIQENESQKSEETLTFVLKEVVTDPSMIFRQEEIQELVKPYINQSVTIKDLYKIVDIINEAYIKKEYMTCRAFLPPQTIHNGIVHIKLVEGRTGKVQVEGNKSTRTGYIKKWFALQEGQIANTGELNRSLQRFNGTNDVILRIKMQGGAVPETTDYVLYVFEPKNHNFTLYMDNNGYETSGRFRYGMFYNWRSVSGQRDSLRLSYLRSQGSDAYSVGYTLPIGYQGLKLDLDYTGNQNKVINGDLKNLSIEGEANAYSLTLRYPLVVTSSHRSEVGFQYLNQKSATTLGHGKINWLDDRLNRYNLFAAFTNYGENSVFYQRYGWLHSKKTDRYGKKENVDLYQVNLYWRKRLAKAHAFVTRFSGQWGSQEYVSTAHRFYIGGMNTVRGYEESFLSGDRGFALGMEYHFPLMKDSLQGLVFLDYGMVSGGYVISGADTLMSTGLGIVWDNKDFYANLLLGLPLKKDVGGKKVDSFRLQFSLSKMF